jgi:hypothetical protein
MLTASIFLLLVLMVIMFLGISIGSTGGGFKVVVQSLWGDGQTDTTLNTIVWHIRFPRVLLAALVGATLSLGGLVFQALLRNPLAEPYILGISGGSAIGLSRCESDGLYGQCGNVGSAPCDVFRSDDFEEGYLAFIRGDGQRILRSHNYVSCIDYPGRPLAQHHLLAYGRSFTDGYETGWHTCAYTFTLFYFTVLVFAFHESAPDGTGNGPKYGGKH